MPTQLIHPPRASANAIRTTSWTLPPLGNLDAYMAAVHNMPMLTLDEEQRYGRSLRDTDDLNAASKLVMSHLRVVTSIAKQYQGYGLPAADLIQEGNLGLMKAVKRFDPDHGVRLVTYAMHWIKAEIHEYVLRNWRIVRLATSKGQRKLFFNLRSKKQALRASTHADYERQKSLSDTEVAAIADQLKVKPGEVREMEARMSGVDVVLDGGDSDDDTPRHGAIAFLTNPAHEPTAIHEKKQRDALATDGVAHALNGLDDRSRRIVTERWLNVNDEGTGSMTLQELAKEYGVSAERVRQIEAKALKKMREFLSSFQMGQTA